MAVSFSELTEELNNIDASYKRRMAIEIIEELEKRQISPFDFLDKMLNSQYNPDDIIPINPLKDCECLENEEV